MLTLTPDFYGTERNGRIQKGLKMPLSPNIYEGKANDGVKVSIYTFLEIIIIYAILDRPGGTEHLNNQLVL